MFRFSCSAFRFGFFYLGLLFFPIGFLSAAPLHIYTYQSFYSDFGPGKSLQDDFERTHECKIEWHESEDAVLLLNRLKMEGKKTQADLILGLDTQLLTQAIEADLVQPHHLTQPKKMRLNWWHNAFIPIDFGELTLIYNAKKITQPPTSWQAFLEHPNWTLIYPDPRTSTPGLGFLLWIQSLYGDKATPFWQQIAKKTITVPSNWGDAYQLFLQGEADFVLSYNTSPIVHQLYDHIDDYKAVEFKEGAYPQIEIAGLAKNAKNIDCAQAFLAYLLTEKAQYEIATKNIMLPVMPIDLPDAFNTEANSGQNFSSQPEISTKSMQQWIKQWRQAVTN